MKLYGKNQIKENEKNKNTKINNTNNTNNSNEKNTGAFLRHCPERFVQYLQDVTDGKQKINISGIQPHQLITEYLNEKAELNQTTELQWKTIINDLRNSRDSHDSCNDMNVYAVADVSGSMSGVPMNVAISLSLILFELYGNDIITFSENPTFHKINKDLSLKEKVNSLSKADWGMNTNFNEVMKLILEKEIMDKHLKKITNDYIQKKLRLFIFSDMQFDKAYNGNFMYSYYKEQFKKHGLEMPEMIYWNLRQSTSLNNDITCPITINEEGTALVSGFSSELLKIFLTGKSFNPLQIVIESISKYDVLIDSNEQIMYID